MATGALENMPVFDENTVDQYLARSETGLWEFQCPTCDRRFESRMAMIWHGRYHHGVLHPAPSSERRAGRSQRRIYKRRAESGRSGAASSVSAHGRVQSNETHGRQAKRKDAGGRDRLQVSRIDVVSGDSRMIQLLWRPEGPEVDESNKPQAAAGGSSGTAEEPATHATACGHGCTHHHAEEPAMFLAPKPKPKTKGERIKEILSDKMLTPEEKSARLQQVYSEKLQPTGQEDGGDENGDGQKVEAEEMPEALKTALSYLKTSHRRSDDKLGCKHYERGAMLVPKCCNKEGAEPKYYVCRLCHDAHENHTIDRFATEEVVCLHCGERQPVGGNCRKCSASFASYFCGKCKFYDDSNRQVYHCEKCGICRIGNPELNKHCDTCKACIATASFEKHKCREGTLDAHCPICTEYLFTSVEKVIFLRCGHSLHKACLMEYLKSDYRCPLCLKSVTNMEKVYRRWDSIADREPQLPEFENKVATVSCNDCNLRSEIPHTLRLRRCRHCSSYNTALISVRDLLPGESLPTTAEGGQPATGRPPEDEGRDLGGDGQTSASRGDESRMEE